MNFDWIQTKKTVAFASSRLVAGLKHSQKILAILVFFSIISCVIVAAYLSYQEIPQDIDPEQWQLYSRSPDEGASPKFYRVVLESIDDGNGTAHLRADFQMSTSPNPPLLALVIKDMRPEEIRKSLNPVQILFGPFQIIDHGVPIFLDWPKMPTRWPIMHPNFSTSTGLYSESRPVSTEANVRLDGNPWLYPFDKYILYAKVGCTVLVTQDRKQYFSIPGDGYFLESKIPNMLVRNAKQKDVDNWAKQTSVDDPDPTRFTKSFKPDMWREGFIVLVLQRPLFPKFFAVFFGIVAIAWLAILAFVSDTKQLSLNAAGYFLALWAIRAPLAAGAPKIDTMFMDYVTLGLYALLVAVVSAKFIWGFRKT